MYLKVSSAKWQPFCLGLNVLNQVRKAVPGDLLPTTAALMLTYQQCGSAMYTKGQYLKDMVKKPMSKIRLQ